MPSPHLVPPPPSAAFMAVVRDCPPPHPHDSRRLLPLPPPPPTLPQPHTSHSQQQQQQQQQFLLGAPVSIDGVQRLFHNGLLLPTFNKSPYPNNITIDSTPSHKRRRADRQNQLINHHQQQQQQNGAHLLHMGVDLNQSLAMANLAPAPPPQNNVSTGLRLAFDDERSSVTSSRPESATPSVAISLREELSAQLLRHQEELNQLLCTQAEQLRAAVEERARRQMREVVAAVESEVWWRRMREAEAEAEGAAKRNAELEERVRQVSMESEMWQSKARNSEAMVGILRSNLQEQVQAVQQQQQEMMEGGNKSSMMMMMKKNRNKDKKMVMVVEEGCGESSSGGGAAEDDAASAYVGEKDGGEWWKNSGRRRWCRVCRKRESTVVLLPCLHLCVCVECSSATKNGVAAAGEAAAAPPLSSITLERCPVCRTAKSAAVEIYLS